MREFPDWLEVWVLLIAGFIGVAAGVAACCVCCLYSRYHARMAKINAHARMAMESPQPPMLGPPIAPGSIIMLPPGPPPMLAAGPPMPPLVAGPPPPTPLGEPPRGYEWQERGLLPLDQISYRSGQR